jgi:hypothetical protein
MLELDQIVVYEGYEFRVSGFRYPDRVYLKPVGITKKVYGSKEILVKEELING